MPRNKQLRFRRCSLHSRAGDHQTRRIGDSTGDACGAALTEGQWRKKTQETRIPAGQTVFIDSPSPSVRCWSKSRILQFKSHFNRFLHLSTGWQTRGRKGTPLVISDGFGERFGRLTGERPVVDRLVRRLDDPPSSQGNGLRRQRRFRFRAYLYCRRGDPDARRVYPSRRAEDWTSGYAAR